MKQRIYLAIDLKSFYASVECVERGLDPMNTNLVVADSARTEKTICLAVSPSLKRYGIPGRPRLFEVMQKVTAINAGRKEKIMPLPFSGSSCNAIELESNPSLSIDYIIAPPRMSHYMKFSTQIYQVYLKYIAPEDIHVYSIDEVFMDITPYLVTYQLTAKELAERMILDVLATTGITATAGIGSNLYLCKVALDIESKHIQADCNGVRIAELDENTYRRKLWTHRPLTDFWRVGRGYAKKLEAQGLYTMGDIARCSLGGYNDYYNEDLLYRMFGVNAELLIDHAWGWEPCTIEQIKAYHPISNSLGSAQVLQNPYNSEQARLVVREMTDLLVLQLVDKGMVAKQITLTVGYDRENLDNPLRRKGYQGEISTDPYGRRIPKAAHGTKHLQEYTSSTRKITQSMMQLFDQIIDPTLLVRRLNITMEHVVTEKEAAAVSFYEQMNLFTDYKAEANRQLSEKGRQCNEKKMQQTILEIKKKYGKNAILKGMNLEQAATTPCRNCQIGGHRA